MFKYLLFFLFVCNSLYYRSFAVVNVINESVVESSFLEKHYLGYLGYETSFNLLQSEKPMILKHKFSLISMLNFDNVSFYNYLSLSNMSKGFEIYRNSNSEYFHSLDYLSFGFSFQNSLDSIQSIFTHTVSISPNILNNSDHLGINFYADYKLDWAYNINDKFQIKLTAQPIYVDVSYKFNPETLGLNYNFIFVDEVKLSYRIHHFQLSGALSQYHLKFIDNTWSLNMAHNFMLSYIQEKLNLYLKYNNSNYPEDFSYSPFFYDRYRQLLALGISYEI